MEPKIVKEEILHKGFFDVKELTIEDGSAVYKRTVVKKRNAACALLKNVSTGKFVFVKQWRAAVDAFTIECPAGTIEENENSQSNILKELIEETGYTAITLKKLGTFMSTPGIVNETIDVFYAETSSKMKIAEGGGLASENENIELVEMTKEEFFKNSSLDMKSALALSMV